MMNRKDVRRRQRLREAVVSDAQKKAISRQMPIWLLSKGGESKKTPERIGSILGLVSIGYPPDVACAKSNVSFHRFKIWMKDDKDLRSKFENALLAAEDLALDPTIEGISLGKKEDTRWWLANQRGHKYNTRIELFTPNSDDALTDPSREFVKDLFGELISSDPQVTEEEDTIHE